MNNPDFSSYNLLWNLLCLLVRSNGSSEGHEYAELLLGGSFEQRQAQNEEQEKKNGILRLVPRGKRTGL